MSKRSLSKYAFKNGKLVKLPINTQKSHTSSKTRKPPNRIRRIPKQEKINHSDPVSMDVRMDDGEVPVVISTKKVNGKNSVQNPRKRKINDIVSTNSEKPSSKETPAPITLETSEIWKNFAYSSAELKYLRKLVAKYSNNKRKIVIRPAKKMRVSKRTADRMIVNRPHNNIDDIRQRASRPMTRSMIKRAVEERKSKDDPIIIESLPDNANSVIDDKKIKPDPKIDEKSEPMLGWVSATRTKYYLLGDTCLDWLTRYYSIYGLTEDKLTNEQREKNKELVKDASHLELLFEGGNRFEDNVYTELKTIYEDEFNIVFDENDYQIFREERDINGFIRTKYNETLDLMNKGMPIIAQAVMINDSNMTYGIADLLVRSDYLSDMFELFEEDETINAPALKIGAANYHYRVIDCKWTTMILCVDGKTLRNDGFFPAYKGQLAIYNACLEQMQGYIPNYAYIMSKAWKIGVQNVPVGKESDYRGFSAFDRLGVIDYAGKDSAYVTRTKEAIQWVQRVMTEGREWRYGKDKPTVPQLYPNMNKDHNPSFSGVKKELANRYGEITQVWFVGLDNRINAHEKGITDIRDPRMSLDVLDYSGKARGPVIKAIIDINKNNQVQDLVRPPKIFTNDMNWQEPHMLDYFIDFETMNYNLFVHPNYMDLDNSYFDSDVTFMIGIGFVHDPEVDSMKIIDALEIDPMRVGVTHRIDQQNYAGVGQWEFVCLYLTDFQVCNELELYRLFFQFMIVRNCIAKQIYEIDDDEAESDSRVFHWTGAELMFMDRAVKRMRSDQYNSVLSEIFNLSDNEQVQTMKREIKDLIRCFEDTVIWVDLCAEMQKEPVVVKGCYRYKLKHFANAMHDHGLILTNWGNGKMSDGFVAMLEAIKIYRSAREYADQGLMEQSIVDTHIDNFREIVDYNEVDCRVMWEIIEYLRSQHSNH